MLKESYIEEYINKQQSDEGGSSDAPKQNRDFQSVEQDDYFDP